MSADTDVVDAGSPSHETRALDLVLKNVDVTCVICLEVCVRNMVVCQRGHSLCYDCAIRVCCAEENRCPTCRAMTFSIEECTPDLTKNSVCELVMSLSGGVELAKRKRLSMMEREEKRREHDARQRKAMRGLVSELHTLSESLAAHEEPLRVWRMNANRTRKDTR